MGGDYRLVAGALKAGKEPGSTLEPGVVNKPDGQASGTGTSPPDQRHHGKGCNRQASQADVDIVGCGSAEGEF